VDVGERGHAPLIAIFERAQATSGTHDQRSASANERAPGKARVKFIIAAA
jgi:hypothetical protein